MTERPDRVPATLSHVVTAIGAALVLIGLIGLIGGGDGFAANPPDGPVAGDDVAGIEANGWTNLVFVANGVLLGFAGATRMGVGLVSVLVGLDFTGAAIAAWVGRTDVLGIFAADESTRTLWSVFAVVLLVLGTVLVVHRRRLRAGR